MLPSQPLTQFPMRTRTIFAPHLGDFIDGKVGGKKASVAIKKIRDHLNAEKGNLSPDPMGIEVAN